MIEFRGEKYEILFSNKLGPFWARNYADEKFFREFKKLCGGQYRILSIIKSGWQNKYGNLKDLEILRKNFLKKTENQVWLEKLKIVYKQSKRDKNYATLDAMSNLLHMFSYLLADQSNSTIIKNIIRFGSNVKDEVSHSLALRQRLSTVHESNKFTVFFWEKNTFQVYERSDAKKFLKQGKFKKIVEDYNRTILNGQTGSVGKARGRALVALDSKMANSKMKKNQVLIAPYTAVEYLPAMRLARAIVTDTGGLTSHAVVVARELGIPCIVGTKVATNVFKTGDMVEVDAEVGVVKKIGK